jgi:prepilin-type N-terminal cleavage/methylation domain-containing protein
MTRGSRPSRAFTLLELVVVMVIVATVASMVLPTMSDDRRLRLIAASSLISSDIELAQVMTISHPDEPIVVRFDPSASTYWLALEATPDTPISRDDNGQPYTVTFGSGRAGGAAGVTFTIDEMDDNTLGFNAQGGVADFMSEPKVLLDADGLQVQLAISAMTATITETDVD